MYTSHPPRRDHQPDAPNHHARGLFLHPQRGVALLVAASLLMVQAVYATVTGLELVSRSADGTPGNNHSSGPTVSENGRYVAFVSIASNLIPGDTNGTADVFVRDRQTGTVERVSVTSEGGQGNGYSTGAAITPDGRYVAFSSDATNLVAGDTNAARDIFVRDRQTGTTERVNLSSSGDQTGIDRYNDSDEASISADGRYVEFWSYASNLVSNDTNVSPDGRNSAADVFVRDRTNGTTERVNVSTGGVQANYDTFPAVISANGRYVAFASLASNLVVGDTNGMVDVFVRDRQTGTTERVSLSTGGMQANDAAYVSVPENSPAISADGRYVAFHSYASNLVAGDTNDNADVFVRDRQTNVTERVSVNTGGIEGNSTSYGPVISADGRYVAFTSFSNNLVVGDTNSATDIFLRDRIGGRTERVSAAIWGGQASSGFLPAISADGRHVAFRSGARQLVEGDPSGGDHVYLATLALADITPPAAAIGAVVTQSSTRVYMPITVSDAGSGVAQVMLTSHSTNCKLEWDGPSGVVTAPIGTPITINPAVASTQVRVVKINTSQRAQVELQAWDAAGNTLVVDPVIANLTIKQRQIERTFNGIPQAERYITLQNGTPGLIRATLTVNGRTVSQGSLSDGQVVSLDVAQWLRPGKRNVVRIAANGPKDATAVLTIGDQAPGAGAGAGAVLPAPGLVLNREFAP